MANLLVFRSLYVYICRISLTSILMIVDRDIILSQYSGRFGDKILRHVGKHTILSRCHDYSNARWSIKQVDNRVRFSDATKYATKVLKDPRMRAIYKKRAQGLQNAWNVAISDFLLNRRIDETDTSGYEALKKDLMRVSAWEEFMALKGVCHVGTGVINKPDNWVLASRVPDDT